MGTPGWVVVGCYCFWPVLSEKSALLIRKALEANRTKKSKIFLAKKRKKFLPFAEECDTISKSRLRHDMR